MRTIVTAGKGGTGKSALLFSLLADHLLPRIHQRILVVDADPHQSLTLLLSRRYGLQAPVSLGELKESHHAKLRSGVGLDDMSRDELAALLVDRALIKLPGAELLVMGPNTLPGCQCVVNTLLDRALDALQERFDLVIVDNEAGIEHIGRHHQHEIDLLLLLATPQLLDLDVAARILEHASRVKREIRHSVLVINKSKRSNPGTITASSGVDQVLSMPYSSELEEGQSPADMDWRIALSKLFDHIHNRLELSNGLSNPRSHL